MNLNFLSKINKLNIIFFFIALIHFSTVFFYTQNFQHQNLCYFFVKLISFTLIITFWQLFPLLINAIKNKNEKITDYYKFLIIYFSLNLIILFITHPYMNLDYTTIQTYSHIKDYLIEYHPNYFQYIQILVFYNIIPSLFGISAVCSFIYSMIFAYAMTELKTKIKTYYIMFIPFCFPFILALNQRCVRFITVGWLLLFILLFIFFNQTKKINNIIKAVLFSLICAITIKYRSELFLLIILLPIVIFHLKIFTKKTLSAFIITLVIFLSVFTCFEKNGEKYHYELHNLSFIFDDYILNHRNDNIIKDNITILNKIYEKSLKNGGMPSDTDDFNMQNDHDTKIAIYSLLKYALFHSPYFVFKHIKEITCSPDVLYVLSNQELVKNMAERENLKLPDIILNEQTNKYKITSLILYFSPIGKNAYLMHVIFHPYFNFLLILLMFIYGIIKKNSFYKYVSLILCFILYTTLLFMYYAMMLYFFAIIINNLFFIFCIISQEINKIIVKKQV